MLTILDRYILRSLVVNYVIALAVMISLYLVLDMLVNMDEFTEQGYPAVVVLKNIADYYWPNVFLVFAQLSGVITLFACAAAVARMRRLNEMTAMLASGVSLYRLAAPIVAFGIVTSGFLVINTEWLIPALAHKLARDHDDADGTRAYEVLFLRDRGGALLSAGRFHPKTRDLQRLLVLKRDESGAVVETIEADHATWDSPGVTDGDGRWRLERGRKRTRMRNPQTGLGPADTLVDTYPIYYESGLSPTAIEMRQAEGWIRFLSLAQLAKLDISEPNNRLSILRTRHARVAAPILGMVLLLLGLPFFLDRRPGNILNDGTKCLIACGLCYVSAYVAQSIQSGSGSALPAWLPIFIFATAAMVLIDRIRT